jgi:hypothetical protein
MKADALPSDDELRRLITSRITSRFRSDLGVVVPVYAHIGTKPPAPWKRKALFAVNDMRAGGATITEALRTVFREFDVGRVGSSSLPSFKRSYEKFRKDDLRDHFYSSILDHDVLEAILALKFCNDQTRHAIWLDLNGDNPPPPSA